MVTHFEELMCDAQLYGWQRVRAFHGVWLNQLEQGRATWQDEEKLRFRCAIVWHPATSSSATSSATRPSGGWKTHKAESEYNAPARPGTKACEAYNEGRCNNGAAHPDQLHIGTHSLTTVNCAFPHLEKDCNRKKGTDHQQMSKGGNTS